MQDGQYNKAVDMYSNLIDVHPDEAVLFSERGVCFIHLKERDNCMADLDESVRLQPDYAYRYASRGHAKDAFGDLDGAIADYQKAVELDPKDDILHNNLGVLLEKKGYQKQAQEAFDRSDKVRKAEEAFEKLMEEVEGVDAKATEKKPENVEVLQEENVEEESSSLWKEFGQLFTSSNQRKEFIQFIKQGLRINAKNDQERKG